MKKYFWMVFAVAVLAACGGKDTPQPTESLTLSVAPQELSFSATESVSKLVVVTSNGDWTVSSTESWIHVNSGSGSGKGSFSVSVDVQDKAEDRSGSVQVSASKGSDSKAATISVKQSGAVVSVDVVPAPAAFDGTKRASTTYQLLIYSFADSDGDGVGDFKGIQNKLDYLDGLGVTALWLSPAHPSGSYHGYEVSDYAALNPLYGTEEDFKALLDAAHAKGISIYMDFVLNHSGTGNEWFKSVTANPKDSPYNDYYVISDNPDAGAVDNFAGTTNPGMGRWFPVLNSGIRKESLHFKLDWTGSKKKVTVSRTTESVQSSNPDTHVQRYIYFGNDKLYRLYETSSNIYEITVDYDSDWGFLVRTSSSSWSAGTKYGGNKYKTGAGVVKLDVPYELEVSVENGYDPGNLVPEGYCYFGSFGESMPDLNYGKYTECENSPVFKATVDAAMQSKIRFDVETIVLPRLKEKLSEETASLIHSFILHVNPTGKFVIGGPHGDTGLTGRKIIVDTYGGKGAHGGGAFSGKDPSKVDRSAAYAARYIAKNLVAAGVASECLVQLAYAIGVAKPVSVYVDTYGTAANGLSDGEIAAKVQEIFDLRPASIIKKFQLKNPIYAPTAAYGHMGRKPYKKTVKVQGKEKIVQFFGWELLDSVPAVKKAFGM